MIQIRKSSFETNSSSVHMLVIPKDEKITIPSRVFLYGGEYGWESDHVTDTINYIYQACLDRDNTEVMKFIYYLTQKGIDVTYAGQETQQYMNSGYIDHSGCVPLEDLFKNSKMLDRFLFGGGWVDTGNDNSDNCPDEENYDSNKYDVLTKYN